MSRRRRYDDPPIDPAYLEHLVLDEEFEDSEWWITGLDEPRGRLPWDDAFGDDDEDDLPF